MRKIWYEVFVKKPSGETQTIKSCDFLKEAKEIKKSFEKEENINVGGMLFKRKELTLHIDKWKNPENPESLGDIK